MQSSALPLGHAADSQQDFTTEEIVIPNFQKSILVISNGHGEDLVSLRIIEALQNQNSDLKIEVLPLVGEGKVFNDALSKNLINKIGPSLSLPSGGFSNQSLRGLILDISVGLLQITWKHWICVRSAAANGRIIIAIGDLLPLFFAWSSGAKYFFVGTPKSDYTWTTSYGKLLSDHYHRLKGTEWEYWEWCLMRSLRCKMVIVRDKLTARGLRSKGVKAFSLGNPMMDGFRKNACPMSLKKSRRLLLLCGSRSPEALDNFRRLVQAAQKIRTEETLTLLTAIGSDPSVNEIEKILVSLGFSKALDNEIHADSFWRKDNYQIFIGVGKFYDWACLAEVGLANAGTATEQLVGLGVPCVSLPGKGPQFKKSFAIKQSRLLGGAVIPCNNSKQFALRVEFLLSNNHFRETLSIIGSRRMGSKGGSAKIAANVLELMFDI